MKKLMFLYLLFIGLSVSTGCFAPTKTIYSTENNKPTTDSFSSTHYEKEILNYLNELRRNPSAFYYKYITTYIKQGAGKFSSYYTNSLKKTLSKLPPLPEFKTSNKLESFSEKQIHYLVLKLKGRTLTHSQGNVSFSERAKSIKIPCIAENLYRASYVNPLELVMDLLIDQGVSSLGHRKNILNPQYTIINIQSGLAINGYVVTVIDFGCER